MQYKVLIVDDNTELLQMLESYFSIKGYAVLKACDGAEAFDKIKLLPDIILLDINMPKVDGIEVCRAIRDKVSCPILFLTARVEEQDRINGLMSGGDDYILKPFSLRELEARIIAHLKREERARSRSRDTLLSRSDANPSQRDMNYGMPCGYKFADGLVIDYSARKIQIEGNELDLTKTEYDIVEFLSSNPGQVFDKERIYEKIRGYDAEGDSRVVTELIRRIRKKMSVYTEKEFIETVWGMGYRWRK